VWQDKARETTRKGWSKATKIEYNRINFSSSSLEIIDQANAILGEYAAREIIVTLRQLYYQFVARALIANKQSEYKRLGKVINDARLSGMIDWDHLQDRTRNLIKLPHWSDPGGVIESAAKSYHRDLWAGQENHTEVWIEKDALVGVIEGACEELDVPFFSCRGYTSQSEMWGASQRLLSHIRSGKYVHIIHLGDHDPSGRDMSRDITCRLRDFVNHHLVQDCAKAKGKGQKAPDTKIDQYLALRPIEVHRIALNMDQVAQYNPPPNPAKITDSRATVYIAEFGAESWELDALNPDVLVGLVRENILLHMNVGLWEEQRDRQEEERSLLTRTSENWDEVRDFVEAL
jgi:hypothetical protein